MSKLLWPILRRLPICLSARCARRWSVADSSEKEVIRITWDEWLASRAAKRAALAAKGLSAPSRRTTSRAEARRAAQEIVRAK